MKRKKLLKVLLLLFFLTAIAGWTGFAWAENEKSQNSIWKEYRLTIFKTRNADHRVKGANVSYKDQFGRDRTVTTDSRGSTPEMTSAPESGESITVTVSSKYNGWYGNPVPLKLPLLPGWNYYHYETQKLSHQDTTTDK